MAKEILLQNIVVTVQRLKETIELFLRCLNLKLMGIAV